MNIEKIKIDFKRVKKLGFVECKRPNNKDGGIGNTFEDLVGVKENNKKESDYLGFKLRVKECLIALIFHCSQSRQMSPKVQILF